MAECNSPIQGAGVNKMHDNTEHDVWDSVEQRQLCSSIVAGIVSREIDLSDLETHFVWRVHKMMKSIDDPSMAVLRKIESRRKNEFIRKG